MPKASKRDEFRKRKDQKGQGHPHYIYAKVGKNKLKCIGITHSDITDGVKNIKLEKNPNPKDTKTAYMKTTPDIEVESHFTKKLKDWKLSDKDKQKAKQVAKNKK